MTNIRLVRGLEALGLDSGSYFLRLSEMIFSMMGIFDENFYKRYIEESNAVMSIDIAKEPKRLDKLTLKLYNMLLKKSKAEREK